MVGPKKKWWHQPKSTRAKHGGPSASLIKREERLHALAYQLLFSVERTGRRFTLTRTVDVSEPVRCKALTLGQAENLLSTWKLRGFHGD